MKKCGANSLWVGLQTIAMRSRIQTDCKLFMQCCREVAGTYRDVLDMPAKKIYGFQANRFGFCREMDGFLCESRRVRWEDVGFWAFLIRGQGWFDSRFAPAYGGSFRLSGVDGELKCLTKGTRKNPSSGTCPSRELGVFAKIIFRPRAFLGFLRVPSILSKKRRYTEGFRASLFLQGRGRGGRGWD